MSLSVRQAVSGSSTGSATTTVTFSALAAGSALIVVVTAPGASSGAVSGITGGGGSTWADAYAADNGTPTFTNIEYWVSLNVSGGATSLTVTHPGSYGLKTVTVYEVAGMVTSGTTTDGTNNTLNNHASAPVGPGSITPSAGVDVLMISASCGDRSVTGVPSGFTAVPVSGTTTNETAYKIVASPSGSYNAIWSMSAPQYGITLLALAAFKAAGGGAPPTSHALFFRCF